MPKAPQPTLARIELGDALRRAREAVGLSPTQAAEKIAYHRNTILRIEKGEQSTKPILVEKLCDVYGVDAPQAAQLTRLARESKQRGWWDAYLAQTGNEKFAAFAETEQTASLIRTWEPEYIPAVVQTPDYLQGLHVAQPWIDVETANALRGMLGKRQELLWARQDHFEIQLLIGMAALLYLDNLPNRVKAVQLERLRYFAAKPHVDIRVVDRVNACMDGRFHILTPAPSQRAPFACVEALDDMRYIESAETVARYEQAFAVSRRAATPVETYLR